MIGFLISKSKIENYLKMWYNKEVMSFFRGHSFLTIFIIILFLVAPLIVSAFQIVPEECTDKDATDVKQCGLCQLLETGVNIFQLGLSILGTVAVLFLVISGFKYIIAGSPEEVASAKDSMQKVIFGLLIVIAAWVLVNSIMFALGYGGEGATWYNFKC